MYLWFALIEEYVFKVTHVLFSPIKFSVTIDNEGACNFLFTMFAET